MQNSVAWSLARQRRGPRSRWAPECVAVWDRGHCWSEEERGNASALCLV